MVWVGRMTTADETWLGRHKPQMRFVPAVFRLGQGENSFVDLAGSALSANSLAGNLLHYANMI